ncbi:hypothetical protein ACH429_04610 [Streptomyces pathocidini]|uniref:Uncharacterized protein n=1 Tax=Streptomyces pathocidini TaxID=1650571 RepID=A0ABW7UL86_9ACTN|nr:hypothetical protein [Streptomyces pathocidini]
MSLISFSSTPQPTAFQLFQPMGGVGASEVAVAEGPGSVAGAALLGQAVRPAASRPAESAAISMRFMAGQ